MTQIVMDAKRRRSLGTRGKMGQSYFSRPHLHREPYEHIILIEVLERYYMVAISHDDKEECSWASDVNIKSIIKQLI